MAKVKFGVSNAVYAPIDPTTGDYGTIKQLPGAVSFSFEAQGENNTFYADNIAYYVSSSNAGYSGDFELAMIPESFRTEVMGETLDSNNVMFEKGGIQPKAFAFGIKVNTDDNKGIYYWFYNCSCTRPTVGGQTTEESTEVSTDTITITVASRASDGMTRCASTSTTSDEVLAAWFTQVYEPTTTP